MNEQIIHTTLAEFLEIAKHGKINFAEIAYNCGAHKFVEQSVDFDCSCGDKTIRTYEFKEFYREKRYAEFHSYYVVSVPNRSYLMYEMQDNITIWVCFTEENFRGKGYIAKLLDYLVKAYPNMTITIDTFNESLKKICRGLGIEIFRDKR